MKSMKYLIVFVLIASVLMLPGCSTNKAADDNGITKNEAKDDSLLNDVEQGVKDAGRDVKNAGKKVADDAEDMVDDIVDSTSPKADGTTKGNSPVSDMTDGAAGTGGTTSGTLNANDNPATASGNSGTTKNLTGDEAVRG